MTLNDWINLVFKPNFDLKQYSSIFSFIRYASKVYYEVLIFHKLRLQYYYRSFMKKHELIRMWNSFFYEVLSEQVMDHKLVCVCIIRGKRILPSPLGLPKVLCHNETHPGVSNAMSTAGLSGLGGLGQWSRVRPSLFCS